MVTSTDSGLAVPDWPLSYGSFFPPMVGGIRFEHTHRLIAATVGLFTFILMIWISQTESRSSLRWLSIAAFGAVVLQGILGGLTVLFHLPVPLSVAHACLGPLFFCLVVSLAVLTDPIRRASHASHGGEEASGFRRLSLLATLFIFLQILLGAILRHTGQGAWLHVLWAFVVFIHVGLLVTKALNDFPDNREIPRLAIFLGLLVTAEFFLGITALAFTRIQPPPPGLGQIIFPTLHQALGSLALATSLVLTLRRRVSIKVLTV